MIMKNIMLKYFGQKNCVFSVLDGLALSYPFMVFSLESYRT